VLWFACRVKNGYWFTLYAVVLLIAIFMNQSRQCIVISLIEFPVCAVVLLVKGKYKWVNAAIVVAVAIGIAVIIAVDLFHIQSVIANLFSNAFDENGQPNGSGRVDYWKLGIQYFSASPLFGVGFYGVEICYITQLCNF
jgi:O-antigen ligase